MAHVDVIGSKDFGDQEPLARDAIFRIASLTKPVAAVAADWRVIVPRPSPPW